VFSGKLSDCYRDVPVSSQIIQACVAYRFNADIFAEIKLY